MDCCGMAPPHHPRLPVSLLRLRALLKNAGKASPNESQRNSDNSVSIESTVGQETKAASGDDFSNIKRN